MRESIRASEERKRKRRSLRLSSIGERILDAIALADERIETQPPASLPEHANAGFPQTEDAEFLVCAGGLCIPTDGALRVEAARGDYYVIGHCTWERCHSAAHAEERLVARIAAVDPHDLVSQAIAFDDSEDDAEL